LLLSFANALDQAPLAQEEKLLVLYMKLVETLMSLDDDRDRNRYAQIFEKHLRENIIEADRSDTQREPSDDLRTVGKDANDELCDLTDDEWFP
jgi:hypothetical protein